MKITKSQLKQIIKEEIEAALDERLGNISAKFKQDDLSQMPSRQLYKLAGNINVALGNLGIDPTDPDTDFASTPETDELMKQRRDVAIAIKNSERDSGARIKGSFE